VPIVLSTDDEGVLRTDLTHEYAKAIAEYHFDYETIKKLVRNSLTYSFAAGKSLWANPDTFSLIDVCKQDIVGSNKPSTACYAFLKQNEKARLQWQLEEQFNEFEEKYA
jgi:adenosine deaminase